MSILGAMRFGGQSNHDVSFPRAYQPITMFDSMTFRARSRSVPVSCM